MQVLTRLRVLVISAGDMYICLYVCMYVCMAITQLNND